MGPALLFHGIAGCVALLCALFAARQGLTTESRGEEHNTENTKKTSVLLCVKSP
jgi:hypothetical protein